VACGRWRPVRRTAGKVRQVASKFRVIPTIAPATAAGAGQVLDLFHRQPAIHRLWRRLAPEQRRAA